MKLITPFTILNQNFHEMDLIREAMNKRRLATKKFHEEYKKMYENRQFAYQYLMEFLNELWHNQPNTIIWGRSSDISNAGYLYKITR